MVNFSAEQNGTLPTPPESEHEFDASPPLYGRLRRYGTTALAIAGVTAAFLTAEVIGAAPSAGANNPVATVGGGIVETTPGLPVEPTDPPGTSFYEGPEQGVATPGLGNDDGGSPQLYGDAAEEGFTIGRLTVPVENSRPILPGIRVQIASMQASGMEPAIVLQQSLNQSPDAYPQEAAQVAAALPRADIFILGNEWNSPYFSKGLSMAQILQMTYLANKAVLAVRPDAETAALALASGFGQVAFMAAATPIVDQQYGGWQNMGTEVDVHLYRTLATDEQMLAADEQYDQGPIEIGEIGWPVSPASSSPGAVSPNQQAANEISWIAAISQDPQIVRNIFYRFQDSLDDSFKTANILADGTKLPSYDALRFDLTGQ